ncbi:MAG: hypothetical protein ACRD2H_01205, partial [Terriglobales bacterium]
TRLKYLVPGYMVLCAILLVGCGSRRIDPWLTAAEIPRQAACTYVTGRLLMSVAQCDGRIIAA